MARIKKPTRYVLVFAQGGGSFAVESWNKPGEFHAVDIMDTTCSCPRFTIDPKDKGKPCRHLRDLAKLHEAGVLESFR